MADILEWIITVSECEFAETKATQKRCFQTAQKPTPSWPSTFLNTCVKIYDGWLFFLQVSFRSFHHISGGEESVDGSLMHSLWKSISLQIRVLHLLCEEKKQKSQNSFAHTTVVHKRHSTFEISFLRSSLQEPHPRSHSTTPTPDYNLTFWCIDADEIN